MTDITQAAADLTNYIRDLRVRAVLAGKVSDWIASDVAITLYGDGTGVVVIRGKRFGDFRRPLTEALDAAEDFLARDERAEANLAIGLTADGRYADECEELRAHG